MIAGRKKTEQRLCGDVPWPRFSYVGLITGRLAGVEPVLEQARMEVGGPVEGPGIDI